MALDHATLELLRQNHPAWLLEKEIYYWGDIDTHGFAIFNQLRGFLPLPFLF